MSIIKCKAEVVSLKWITPTVFILEIKPREKITFIAGQFLSLILPGLAPNGKDLRRAYSIASPPEQDTIELCIKRVEGGPATNFLACMQPGDTMDLMAPYGHFVLRPNPQRTALFIGTGTGIAPYYSILTSNLFKTQPPLKTTMLFGCRHLSEILYTDFFSRASGVEWVPCVSQPEGPWEGYRGRVSDYLKNIYQCSWPETDFYLCGNGEMIKEVKAFLIEKGVDKKAIFQEAYY